MLISINGVSQDTNTGYHPSSREKVISNKDMQLHWQAGTYYTKEAASLAKQKNAAVEARQQQEWNDAQNAVKESWANGQAYELTLDHVCSSEHGREALPKQEKKPYTYDLSYWEVNHTLTHQTVNEKDSYLIDGVSFTGEEMKAFQSFFNRLKDYLPGTYWGGLNYHTYARLGMGVSAVRAYGEAKLSKEQTDAICNVVKYYNEGIKYGCKSRLEQYNPSTMEGRRYYNMLIDEKKFAEIEGWGGDGPEYALHVNHATDLGLAEQIYKLYANSDITNDSSMESAFQKFKIWIRPAYEELAGPIVGYQMGIKDDQEYFSRSISDARAMLRNLGFESVDVKI